jgi:hypothetical protein
MKTFFRTALTGLAFLGFLSVATGAPEGGPPGNPPVPPPPAPPAGGPPAGAPPAGMPPAPGAPQVEMRPNFIEGMRLFDEAVHYVAKGQQTIPSITSFYASLDMKMELPEQPHLEGRMRVWFMDPDKFRSELSTNNDTTTKILNGELAWVVTASGVSRLHGTPDGAKDISDLKDMRERLKELSKFLTLKGLKGPGIGFEYMGPTTGSGTYAGEWIKVVRHSPGNSDITFWLAYGKDASGQMHATWPGIVRIAGDPAHKYPQEDYILKEWDSPQSQLREFRYPRKIEAYQKETGKESVRFLWAELQDIKLNTVDPTTFNEPRPMPAR